MFKEPEHYRAKRDSQCHVPQSLAKTATLYHISGQWAYCPYPHTSPDRKLNHLKGHLSILRQLWLCRDYATSRTNA